MPPRPFSPLFAFRHDAARKEEHQTELLSQEKCLPYSREEKGMHRRKVVGRHRKTIYTEMLNQSAYKESGDGGIYIDSKGRQQARQGGRKEA